LKNRILTAVVGIPIVAAILLGPPILTEIFILLVAVGMTWEYGNVTGQTSLPARIILIGLVVGIVSLAAVLSTTELEIEFILLILLTGIAVQTVLAQRPWVAVAPMYIGIGLACVIALRLLDAGQEWLVVLLAGTWATDTLALFGGKRFGKTKLAPRISPNKTREGTAIGIVFGAAAILLAGALVGLLEKHTLTIVLAAILLPPLAVIGDLTESRLKRHYGKKDSGGILPGHGGLLDRVDSTLFTATALWILNVFTT
jgi:phosphatidate cytidylyltransferase